MGTYPGRARATIPPRHLHHPTRLVLQRDRWRVVALELPDQHGVVRTQYLIEVTDPGDTDLLGVQRWRELTAHSALSDWITVARCLLDDVLRHAGETPEEDR